MGYLSLLDVGSSWSQSRCILDELELNEKSEIVTAVERIEDKPSLDPLETEPEPLPLPLATLLMVFKACSGSHEGHMVKVFGSW